MTPPTPIIIVNYGMGNLGSIQSMMKHIGYETLITADPQQIERAEKLILPGVGHFDRGMEQLHALDLIDVLNHKVLAQKTPVLGICLGMQLMGSGSEEGKLEGLKWVDADFVRFNPHKAKYPIRIPQMSWNYVRQTRPTQLMTGLNERPRFYFVHAYHAIMANAEDAILTTEYGYEYVSGFERENIIGVQFHPEKSHKFGMKLLQNFSESYSWTFSESA
jgi:glutamine amidotransferase